MRIGEIAAAVGVTTRTVRHYHHLGLLPEPERRANGYRRYSLRHAVVLARIRRLTELGLGLAEVRDVLADDAGRELAEVLAELDEDLARQEAAIRERRARLRALLEQGMSAEGPVSPELSALFREMARRPGPEPTMAAKDREVLALIEATAEPGVRERMVSAVREAFGTPEAVERAYAVYALLDELADAAPTDPRIDSAARMLVEATPVSLFDALDPDTSSFATSSARSFATDEAVFLRAFYADFAPAQAEAIRRALDMITEQRRERRESQEGREGREGREEPAP